MASVAPLIGARSPQSAFRGQHCTCEEGGLKAEKSGFDLDWEGLNILKSIREAFPVARAWQPGYEPMVKLLKRGIGHTPEQADKEGQREVHKTGCDYADSVLREALLSTGLFLDQEVLSGEELQRTDGRGSP